MAQGQATLNQILAVVNQVLEVQTQITAAITAQNSQIKTLNTFVEGLQEAIRNQGVPPEFQAKVDEVLKASQANHAAIQANDQLLAGVFTENTPSPQS